MSRWKEKEDSNYCNIYIPPWVFISQVKMVTISLYCFYLILATI